MLKSALRILTLCSLVASCGAAELPQLVNDLSSDNYQARVKAREELQALVADASKPGADTTRRIALEEQLLTQLDAETEQSAQLWIIRMLEWFGSERSVAGLASYLSDAHAEVQDAARRALAANPSEAAAKVLNDALEQAPVDGKRAWIDALVYRGDHRAARSILSLLESEDPAVVGPAATALAKLGESRFLEPLSAARARVPGSIKPIIESAMLTIGVKPGVAGELVRTGSASSIRSGAFKQLAAQDAKAALTVLAEVLANTDTPGRKEMLRIAMGSRQAELVKRVVGYLPQANPPDQQVILGAIADLALSDYEQDVLALLPSASGPARGAVLFALGVIGGEESVQPLIDAYLASPGEGEMQALARLRAPSLDARLFADIAEGADVEKRLATATLLALRNPIGTVEVFNQLAGSEQDETLVKAVYKALESVGNAESGKVLAAAVVGQGALRKPAQQSLKKLSLNLGIPVTLWDAVYHPALESAPSDAAREDLLAILDGVACPGSLGYLDALIADSASPLRQAAIRSLSRWPEFEAGESWMKLLSSAHRSDEDIAAAQKGLIRILTRGGRHQKWQERIDLAAKAFPVAPSPGFKTAILDCYKRAPPRQKAKLEQSFTPFLDDPDVGLKVYALLGKTPPPPPSVEPGFVSLFDGATRKGWTRRGGKARYAARNGVIVGTSVLHTPNTFLCTDELYGDFELRFEVKCGPINSGVQIRTQEDEKGHVHGPQVEIEHSPGQAGYVYGEGMGTGWLSPEPKSKDATVKQHNRLKNDAWNEYRVIAQGPRIQTFINGERVADLTHGESFGSHPKGFIGLQVHGHNVAGVEIEWRNIRIKELAQTEEQWTSLLDEELSAWDVWTGSPHKSVQNLPEGTAVSEDGKKGKPMGLGDPMKLYTVSKDADGALVMAISGEVYGGITTRESFSNYHLTMQFKWGEKKWEPRLEEKRDSGLLYHCYGEHGAFWNVWKRCLEFQILEGDFGDLHCIGQTAAVVPVNESDHWDPKSTKTAKRGNRSMDAESPHGEWTRIDLYVVDDAAVHVVNGKVVLALREAKSHEGSKLDAGQLQIQSEAAECFAKDIRIRPITDFPEEIRTAEGL